MTRFSTLSVILLSLFPIAGAQPAPRPEMVLFNGKILTVDDDFRIAQAVAVGGGRILAVGDDRAILETAGSALRIDLEGRTVVPGLIDTHSHVHNYAERNFGNSLTPDQLRVYPVNFRVVKSKDDVLSQISRTLKAIQAPPGEWVHFSSRGISGKEHVQIIFDQLNRWELDRAAPENPIVLSMGIPVENGYLVNGRTLDLLWERYGDFLKHYGRYWTDDEGRPDGHLEPPASRLVMNYFRPRPEPGDLAAVYSKTLEEWSAMGITTVSTKLHREDVEAYRFLESQGALLVRVAYGADWLFGSPTTEADLLREAPGQGSGQVWMSSVTAVGLDGSGARQCTALQRNSDAAADSGTMGISLLGDWYPQGQCHLDIEYKGAVNRGASLQGNYYRDWLFTVARTGHRVANMHVAGDRSQSLYLTALEQIAREDTGAVRNWALDHCTLVNPEDIQRAARMGVVWSCAPKYIPTAETIARAYGTEVAERFVVPVRSMVDAGIHVAFEMDRDGYVWNDLELLLTREVEGKVWGPDERIDRRTALKMITRWGAEYVLRKDELGSIEAGKRADLVVLDRDYLTIPAEQVSEIRPLMTVMDGKTTFLDPEFADHYPGRPAGAVLASYRQLRARH